MNNINDRLKSLIQRKPQVSFKTLQTESEVRRELQKYLPLSATTSGDVRAFLDTNRFRYSEQDWATFPFPDGKEADYAHLYQSAIFVLSPAPTSWRIWPASGYWQYRLHFRENRLVEIEVEKQWVSL